MASDSEASCVSDPNFAVICSFLQKFGALCGITSPDFLELQEMLENTQELSQELIDIHLKLLRRIKKSVSADRWERVLIKVCHTYCSQDAWEVERFGYRKATLSSKLRILKTLLEMQFDFHHKFKTEVNNLTPDELRTEPIGRDKHGHSYWYQIDDACQLRVYREDPDEETWGLVANDREGLVRLISQLASDDPNLADLPLNEDSNSLEIEKPLLDTGQVSSTSNDDSPGRNEDSKDVSDAQTEKSPVETSTTEISVNTTPEIEEHRQTGILKLKISTALTTPHKTEKEASEETKNDENVEKKDEKLVGIDLSVPQTTIQTVKEINKKKKSINDLAANLRMKTRDMVYKNPVQEQEMDLSVKKPHMDPKQFSSLSVPPFEPMSIESALRMSEDSVDEEIEEDELFDEEEITLPSHMKQPRLDRPTLLGNAKKKTYSDEEEEYSEEIEEPIMLIQGEGSGKDNETENISEILDRPTLFGNTKKNSHSDEEEEYGEEIEEPEMLIQGEGSGKETENIPEDYSEAVEEPVMFFYGEGSGYECDTGNPGNSEETDQSDTKKTESVVLENKSESGKEVSPKSHKIGTIVIDVKSGTRSQTSDTASSKRTSRWDIGKPDSEDSIKKSTNNSIKNNENSDTNLSISSDEADCAVNDIRITDVNKTNETSSNIQEALIDCKTEEKSELGAPKFFFGPGCFQFKAPMTSQKEKSTSNIDKTNQNNKPHIKKSLISDSVPTYKADNFLDNKEQNTILQPNLSSETQSTNDDITEKNIETFSNLEKAENTSELLPTETSKNVEVQITILQPNLSSETQSTNDDITEKNTETFENKSELLPTETSRNIEVSKFDNNLEIEVNIDEYKNKIDPSTVSESLKNELESLPKIIEVDSEKHKEDIKSIINDDSSPKTINIEVVNRDPLDKGTEKNSSATEIVKTRVEESDINLSEPKHDIPCSSISYLEIDKSKENDDTTDDKSETLSETLESLSTLIENKSDESDDQTTKNVSVKISQAEDSHQISSNTNKIESFAISSNKILKSETSKTDLRTIEEENSTLSGNTESGKVIYKEISSVEESNKKEIVPSTSKEIFEAVSSSNDENIGVVSSINVEESMKYTAGNKEISSSVSTEENTKRTPTDSEEKEFAVQDNIITSDDKINLETQANEEVSSTVSISENISSKNDSENFVDEKLINENEKTGVLDKISETSTLNEQETTAVIDDKNVESGQEALNETEKGDKNKELGTVNKTISIESDLKSIPIESNKGFESEEALSKTEEIIKVTPLECKETNADDITVNATEKNATASENPIIRTEKEMKMVQDENQHELVKITSTESEVKIVEAVRENTQLIYKLPVDEIVKESSTSNEQIKNFELKTEGLTQPILHEESEIIQEKSVNFPDDKTIMNETELKKNISIITTDSPISKIMKNVETVKEIEEAKIVGKPIDLSDKETVIDKDETKIVEVGKPIDLSDKETVIDKKEKAKIVEVGKPIDLSDKETVIDKKEEAKTVEVRNPIDLSDKETIIDKDEAKIVEVRKPINLSDKETVIDKKEEAKTVEVRNPIDLSDKEMIIDKKEAKIVKVGKPIDLSDKETVIDKKDGIQESILAEDTENASDEEIIPPSDEEIDLEDHQILSLSTKTKTLDQENPNLSEHRTREISQLLNEKIVEEINPKDQKNVEELQASSKLANIDNESLEINKNATAINEKTIIDVEEKRSLESKKINTELSTIMSAEHKASRYTESCLKAPEIDKKSINDPVIVETKQTFINTIQKNLSKLETDSVINKNTETKIQTDNKTIESEDSINSSDIIEKDSKETKFAKKSLDEQQESCKISIDTNRENITSVEKTDHKESALLENKKLKNTKLDQKSQVEPDDKQTDIKVLKISSNTIQEKPSKLDETDHKVFLENKEPKNIKLNQESLVKTEEPIDTKITKISTDKQGNKPTIDKSEKEENELKRDEKLQETSVETIIATNEQNITPGCKEKLEADVTNKRVNDLTDKFGTKKAVKTDKIKKVETEIKCIQLLGESEIIVAEKNKINSDKMKENKNLDGSNIRAKDDEFDITELHKKKDMTINKADIKKPNAQTIISDKIQTENESQTSTIIETVLSEDVNEKCEILNKSITASYNDKPIMESNHIIAENKIERSALQDLIKFTENDEHNFNESQKGKIEKDNVINKIEPPRTIRVKDISKLVAQPIKEPIREENIEIVSKVGKSPSRTDSKVVKENLKSSVFDKIKDDHSSTIILKSKSSPEIKDSKLNEKDSSDDDIIDSCDFEHYDNNSDEDNVPKKNVLNKNKPKDAPIKLQGENKIIIKDITDLMKLKPELSISKVPKNDSVLDKLQSLKEISINPKSKTENKTVSKVEDKITNKAAPLLKCVDITKLKVNPPTSVEVTKIKSNVENKPKPGPKSQKKVIEKVKPIRIVSPPKPPVTLSVNEDEDDVIDVPETDPLACTEEDIIRSKTEESKTPSLSLATFKLDDTEDTDSSLIPTPIARALRSRRIAAQPIIIPRKRSTEVKIEEIGKRGRGRGRPGSAKITSPVIKIKDDTSSEEESVKMPMPQRGTGKARRGRGRGRGRGFAHIERVVDESPVLSSDAQSETSRTEAVASPEQKTPRGKKKKRVLGLDIDPALIIAPVTEKDSDEPVTRSSVRQSRRIAQIKIKEEAERVKIDDFVHMERKHKKKKKREDDKDYKLDKKKKKYKELTEEEEESDDELIEETSLKTKDKKKRKHQDLKKLFNMSKPWQSSSESSTSNDEEEEEAIEEYSDEEVPPVLKSDHEFSPESDLENNVEVLPLRRARTVKKESDTEEPADEHACQKCNKMDHPEWILLCDKCDNGWHCSCLRPALLVIPEGDWYCPPCQHISLVEALKNQLVDYDKKLNRRDMEVRRKQRLDYVGISLANVLPSKESEEKDLKDEEQVGSKENSSESDSESGSTDSSSGSDSDEPIYQLRQRRQAHSYRFNDYDELINSAIQDEIEAVKGAGNQGRGKDIATIVNAEKEEEAKTQALEQTLQAPEIEQPPPVVPVYEEKLKKQEASEESSDEERPRVVPKSAGRKKHRKLNSLDISSEDDAADDEDFKGTSASEEDDFEDLGSDDSDELESGRRGRGRSGPTRRSTRARTTRYDREFINDDSEDDLPKHKKSKSMWDESESEESDKSWGKIKRSKKQRQFSLPKSSKKSRKRKRRHNDSDSEVKKPKRPKIKYGGLDDSDDEEFLIRRTRGKKINYIDALGSDSEEEKVKKVKPIESEDEYVVNEEEEEIGEVIDEEKDSESDSVKNRPVIPKKIIKIISPSKAAKGRGKAGIPRPLHLTKQPSPSPPILQEPKSIDKPEEVEEPPASENIPVIAANPDDLNEEEVGTMMMENEEYAKKQLELMAIQLAKEKKKKEEEEIEKKETVVPLITASIVPEISVNIPPGPKKRGRKKKSEIEAMKLAAAKESPPDAPTNESPEKLPPGEIPATISDLTNSPPKRRGRGKGKKTLAAEAAASTNIPVESNALSETTVAPPLFPSSNLNISTPTSTPEPQTLSPNPNLHGKLGIAAPPQPFAQNQPTPSVITRMLQAQPMSAQTFATAPNAINQKYFAPEQQPPRGTPSEQFSPIGRGRVPSPYRQSPIYSGVRQMAPNRLRSPGPPNIQMFHSTHHSLDPSPSGGGPINIPPNRDRNSPGNKDGLTPPPPPYTRTLNRFSPNENSPGPSLPPPIRHHIFPQSSPPPRGNFSPYHPPPPPNYHYGAYPPADDALPATDYQGSPYTEPYHTAESTVHSSEGSNSKPFDEEGTGEFGGLVSYFSSQREDDLDT